MKKSNALFVSFTLYCCCCCWFFASVLIFNNKDKIKNGYIVIINIVINIKKGNGGNNAVLLSDCALELSENFNSSFLRTDFVDYRLQMQSFFVKFHEIIHNFEGLLIENVKIKITNF